MFFLIRCVFWLTVVYSTIFSQDPVRQEPVAQEHSQTQAAPRDKIGELAQTWISAALSLVERKAIDRCATTPADCLARTAILSPGRRLLAGTPTQQGPVQAQAVPQPAAQVPLPPPRPKFAAEKSMRSGLEKSSRAEYVMKHSGRG